MSNETSLDFFGELDVYVRNIVGVFFDKLKLGDIDCSDATIQVKVKPEFLEKYGLTNSIGFYVRLKNHGTRMMYCYNQIEIKPKSYYILPDNYRKPCTLEILQAAIQQDTYEPDIHDLELDVA